MTPRRAPTVTGSTLTVFAAASLTESLNAIGEKYMADNQNVTLVFNYDSSGTLYKQIKEGAVCDLFISAAPKQMNQLDGTLKDDAEKNPDGLDMLLAGSRIDLLENKVALAVTDGNPEGIDSFDEHRRSPQERRCEARHRQRGRPRRPVHPEDLQVL